MVSLELVLARFGWWYLGQDDPFLEHDDLGPAQLAHYTFTSHVARMVASFERDHVVPWNPRSPIVHLVLPFSVQSHRYSSSSRDEDLAFVFESGWYDRRYRQFG